jgi:hypothetical protein
VPDLCAYFQNAEVDVLVSRDDAENKEFAYKKLALGQNCVKLCPERML